MNPMSCFCSVIKGSDEKGGGIIQIFVYVSHPLCPKFRLDDKLFLPIKLYSTLVPCVLLVIMVKAGTDSAVQTIQYISQE